MKQSRWLLATSWCIVGTLSFRIGPWPSSSISFRSCGCHRYGQVRTHTYPRYSQLSFQTSGSIDLVSNDHNAVEPAHTFNGGKMEHIFCMEKQNRNMKYTSRFTSREAKEALEKSNRMFWKIDGSCGMLVLDVAEDTICLYQRQDTRGKSPGPTLVSLPRAGSGNPSTFNFHAYYMEKMVLCKSDGKKLRKTKEAVMNLLARHKDTLQQLIAEHSHDEITVGGRLSRCLSVEIVGTKYAQTAGVQSPVAIAPHCLQKIHTVTVPRTFDDARDLLINSSIVTEGIVIEYEGKYWKCVSKLLDPACAFGIDKSKAMPPLVFYE